MSQKKNNSQDVAKIELLFGIQDGDTIQLAQDSHQYVYHKATENFFDENGSPIDSAILIQMINHPESVVCNNSGDNVYVYLGQLTGKFFINILLFSIFAIVLFKAATAYVSIAWSIPFVVFLICFVLCLIGIGVSAGMIIASILKNKEIIL